MVKLLTEPKKIILKKNGINKINIKEKLLENIKTQEYFKKKDLEAEKEVFEKNKELSKRWLCKNKNLECYLIKSPLNYYIKDSIKEVSEKLYIDIKDLKEKKILYHSLGKKIFFYFYKKDKEV
jgi:hypothetical protein